MDSSQSTNSQSTRTAASGDVRRALRRSLTVWMSAFLVFCVTDYIHVQHGPVELGWFDGLFLPLFCLGIFWANSCLFPDEPILMVRGLEVVTVTFFASIVGVYLLMFFGIGFHGMIGGVIF